MANTKVTTGVIKDDAVGADQLASNAVVTASITDNAITTAKINDNAILTAKINDSAITNAKMSSNSVDSDQYVDASIDTVHIRDGQITSAKLDTNISISGELTVGSHLNMGDGDILKMGASADLQIFHDASGGHSRIDDTGTGGLVIRGSQILLEKYGGGYMINAVQDSSVELYYSGAKKLETTSGGVSVTGEIAGVTAIRHANSNAQVIDNDNDTYFIINDPEGSNRIKIGDSGDRTTEIRNDTIKFTLADGTEKMRLDASGNLGIGVTPTAQLEVQDANGVSLKFGDLASYPNNVVPCFIGTGTSALAGVNGDLVLVPRTSDAGKIILATGHNGAATEKVRITPTEMVINEGSLDYDFRVESNNNSNMLFVDGGNNSVSVGTGALPTLGTLVVQQTADSKGIAVIDSTATNTFFIENQGDEVKLRVNDSSPITFLQNSTELFKIASSGNVGIGVTPETDWHSNYKALQLNTGGAIASYASGTTLGTVISTNQRTTGNTFINQNKYIIDGAASLYLQDNVGKHNFYTAASGSADATITWVNTVKIDASGVLINEDSNDQDFRVESNNNTHMLFVDGGNNRVGIGAVPMSNGSTFQVTSDITESNNLQLTLRGASDINKQMIMGFDTTANTAHITTQIAGASPTPLIFKTGNVVFNENSQDSDFRVESNNNTHALFVDGASGIATLKVGVTVARDTHLGGAVATIQSNNNQGLAIGYGTGTNEFRRLYHHATGLYFESSTNQAYLSASGAWTNASDVTLKKDIEDIDYGIETVKSLKPRKYKMKSNDEAQIGFIAQELVKQVPEIVGGKEGLLGVSYGQLTAVLTKAIQEQQTLIESLTARIEELEG